MSYRHHVVHLIVIVAVVLGFCFGVAADSSKKLSDDELIADILSDETTSWDEKFPIIKNMGVKAIKPLLVRLRDAEGEKSKDCHLALSALMPEAAPELFAELKTDNQNVRDGLQYILSNYRNNNNGTLCYIREGELVCLAEIQQTYSFDVLSEALQSDNLNIHTGALEIAGRIRPFFKESLAFLVKDLLHENLSVRQAAIHALAVAGGEAKSTVKKMAESEDYRLRAAAALIYGHYSYSVSDKKHAMFKLLKDKHPQVRAYAAIPITRIQGELKQVDDEIFSSFSDPDPFVRSMITRGLINSEGQVASAYLLRGLKSENEDESLEVAKDVYLYHEKVDFIRLFYIKRILEIESPQVRKPFLRALAVLGKDIAEYDENMASDLTDLILANLKSQDEQISREAAYALVAPWTTINDLELLNRLLGHQDPSVRFRALVKISKLVNENNEKKRNSMFFDDGVDFSSTVPHLVPLLDDDYWWVRNYALSTLSIIGEPIPDLQDKLKFIVQNDYDSIAHVALTTMGFNGEESVSFLREQFQSTSSWRRHGAIWGIAATKENAKTAIPEMKLALNDKLAEVQEAALIAITYLGNEAAELAPDVVRLLSTFPRECDCREHCQVALIRMGDGAVASVLTLLDSDEEFIREEAINTLGMIAASELLSMMAHLPAKKISPEAKEVIKQALLKEVDDENHWIRLAALEAISGKFDLNDQDLQTIATRINDRNYEVRTKAMQIIANRNADQALPYLLAALENENSIAHKEIVGKLSKFALMDERGLLALDKCLQSPDFSVRISAFGEFERLWNVIRDSRMNRYMNSEIKDNIQSYFAKKKIDENHPARNLKSNDPIVRMAGVLLLEENNAPAKEYLPVFDDFSLVVNLFAGIIVLDKTQEGKSLLIKLMDSRIPEVRAAAIGALTYDKEFAAKALKIGLNDKSMIVREISYRMFYNTSDIPSETIDVENTIIRGLNDQSPEICLVAIRSINKKCNSSDNVYSELMKLADNNEQELHEDILWAISQMKVNHDRKALPLLIEAAHNKQLIHEETYSVTSLLYALVKIEPISDETSKVILELLAEYPESGSEALAKIGEAAMPILAKAGESENWHVRLGAVMTYIYLSQKHPKYLNELLRFAKDPDYRVQSAALEALGRYSSDYERSLPLFLEALSHEKASMRTAALTALKKFPLIGEGAEAALVASLPNMSEMQILQVLEILTNHNIQNPETIDALLALEEDKFFIEDLGKKVNRIIVKTDPDVFMPVLIKHLDNKKDIYRINAFHNLSCLGKEAKPAMKYLLAAMRDSDSLVRANAAESLGNIGIASWRIVRKLRKTLKDRDPMVRFYAAKSLGKLGAEKALRDLQKLTDDDCAQVRREALLAIDRINNTKNLYYGVPQFLRIKTVFEY